MRYVKLQWQEASDPDIRGYYAYDKYGVRHKVLREFAEELKLTMKPFVFDSKVMTLGGYIKETIWYKE
jgi:hypothetical protein